MILHAAFMILHAAFMILYGKRLRVYTLHNSKKAVTADKTNAVTAFSIGQEVSLYIFPMGYLVAILQSFLLRRICIQTD